MKKANFVLTLVFFQVAIISLQAFPMDRVKGSSHEQEGTFAGDVGATTATRTAQARRAADQLDGRTEAEKTEARNYSNIPIAEETPTSSAIAPVEEQQEDEEQEEDPYQQLIEKSFQRSSHERPSELDSLYKKADKDSKRAQVSSHKEWTVEEESKKMQAVYQEAQQKTEQENKLYQAKKQEKTWLAWFSSKSKKVASGVANVPDPHAQAASLGLRVASAALGTAHTFFLKKDLWQAQCYEKLAQWKAEYAEKKLQKVKHLTPELANKLQKTEGAIFKQELEWGIAIAQKYQEPAFGAAKQAWDKWAKLIVTTAEGTEEKIALLSNQGRTTPMWATTQVEEAWKKRIKTSQEALQELEKEEHAHQQELKQALEAFHTSEQTWSDLQVDLDARELELKKLSAEKEKTLSAFEKALLELSNLKEEYKASRGKEAKEEVRKRDEAKKSERNQLYTDLTVIAQKWNRSNEAISSLREEVISAMQENQKKMQQYEAAEEKVRKNQKLAQARLQADEGAFRAVWSAKKEMEQLASRSHFKRTLEVYEEGSKAESPSKRQKVEEKRRIVVALHDSAVARPELPTEEEDSLKAFPASFTEAQKASIQRERINAETKMHLDLREAWLEEKKETAHLEKMMIALEEELAQEQKIAEEEQEKQKVHQETLATIEKNLPHPEHISTSSSSEVTLEEKEAEEIQKHFEEEVGGNLTFLKGLLEQDKKNLDQKNKVISAVKKELEENKEVLKERAERSREEEIMIEKNEEANKAEREKLPKATGNDQQIEEDLNKRQADLKKEASEEAIAALSIRADKCRRRSEEATSWDERVAWDKAASAYEQAAEMEKEGNSSALTLYCKAGEAYEKQAEALAKKNEEEAELQGNIIRAQWSAADAYKEAAEMEKEGNSEAARAYCKSGEAYEKEAEALAEKNEEEAKMGKEASSRLATLYHKSGNAYKKQAEALAPNNEEEAKLQKRITWAQSNVAWADQKAKEMEKEGNSSLAGAYRKEREAYENQVKALAEQKEEIAMLQKTIGGAQCSAAEAYEKAAEMEKEGYSEDATEFYKKGEDYEKQVEALEKQVALLRQKEITPSCR